MADLDPSALIFRDDHEVIPGGHAVRIANFNRFVEVMEDSDLDREEDVSGYNRTARNAVPVDPASTWQRHQSEEGINAKLWFDVQGYPIRPFSVDMSACLMVPRTVPDNLSNGEDGPATV